MWMPSHVKPGQCGHITRGDGFLLTEADVEHNGHAGRLTKRAVAEHRAPFRIRQSVAAHNLLTTQNAIWIARATVIANQQTAEPRRDTQASRANAAAAAAAKRQAKLHGPVLSPPWSASAASLH